MASIISSVRSWIADCPLLDDEAIINIDKLGAEPIGYTVDSTPCEPIYKQYVDGSSLRRFQFVFASRESYGATLLQNIANSEFYDNFADWIEQQNKDCNLPAIGSYRDALSVSILTSGYAYDTGDNTARYQIQLELIYKQDRRYKNGQGN